MAFETRFTLELPFGVCVGVSLPDAGAAPFALPAELHPGEAAFAAPLPAVRRAAWTGGRVALRRALAAAGLAAPAAILATPRGGPALPPGVLGSISHKREIAVALAAAASEPRSTIGIDVEGVRPLHPGVAEKVLTEAERAALPPAGPGRDAAVLLRFSAKEAIYKALDPWVGRFVDFKEAQVDRAAGGTLRATLALKGAEGPFTVALHDAEGAAEPDLILTAARIMRAG